MKLFIASSKVNSRDVQLVIVYNRNVAVAVLQYGPQTYVTEKRSSFFALNPYEAVKKDIFRKAGISQDVAITILSHGIEEELAS